MSLVLACAQQHDGGNPRRESGHGARSLDWVRPIAPVAHRTERSAPDRKAAGSIPARRTKTRIRNVPGAHPAPADDLRWFAGNRQADLVTKLGGRCQQWQSPPRGSVFPPAIDAFPRISQIADG